MFGQHNWDDNSNMDGLFSKKKKKKKKPAPAPIAPIEVAPIVPVASIEVAPQTTMQKVTEIAKKPAVIVGTIAAVAGVIYFATQE